MAGSTRSSALSLRAGPEAMRELAEHGFSADRFGTLVGASGGPKWLVLSQIDRVLADVFVRERRSPLDMVGSSIGSFRHACLGQTDPHAAIERFETAYIEQAYSNAPTTAEVSRVSREVLARLLGDRGGDQLLHSELLQTHVIVTHLPGVASDAGVGFRIRLGAAALGNAISRANLGRFFHRAVFRAGARRAASGTGSDRTGLHFSDFPTHLAELTRENLHDAILASGSIPFVMDAVRGIAGAPEGLYLDGGLLDYHFDFRFRTRPGLTLYPHFLPHITPGWLDKFPGWRRAHARDLARVVMISPSREFIAKLPDGRIPDRRDFQALSTAERHARWRGITDRCRRLADELHDAIACDRFVERLTPLSP